MMALQTQFLLSLSSVFPAVSFIPGVPVSLGTTTSELSLGEEGLASRKFSRRNGMLFLPEPPRTAFSYFIGLKWIAGPSLSQ